MALLSEVVFQSVIEVFLLRVLTTVHHLEMAVPRELIACVCLVFFSICILSFNEYRIHSTFAQVALLKSVGRVEQV